MILLDTHVLLWAIEEGGRLGPEAVAITSNGDLLVYSAISAWEIGMLLSKDRIKLSTTPAALLARASDEAGILEVAISGAMALDAGTMPTSIHGDPCDRILMATARALTCPMLTADEKILAYAAEGHVQAIDARR